ncbi:DUF6883 domain-containing protein [Aerosakkonemataceae cyanobacterium BLCC-F50]|uniref:DUF6883 domain-containing protein n=1 Tax=Floridaenema flaviceps BLCC-F50 TaxID=3153642 RepID=A0ABV4XQM5_9CYAN
MKIPADAEIPDSKLTRYLLVYKARNDKSKFLAQAGFKEQNPEVLREAIRLLIESNEAVEDGTNEYGIFYRVAGELIGIDGASLSVITIWLQRKSDGKFQFVTLKPFKESRYEN